MVCWLEKVKQLGKQSALGESGAHMLEDIRITVQAGTRRGPDAFDHRRNIAMLGGTAPGRAVQFIDEVSHMAGSRPEVKHRRANRENVVNLARMNRAHEWIAHDHDMKIRRRERT